MTASQPRHCESCKSDISSDDILQRRAGLVAGVLLCNDCVEKKRQAMTGSLFFVASEIVSRTLYARVLRMCSECRITETRDTRVANRPMG